MTVLLRRTSHITSGISRIQQTNRVFRSRAEMPDLSSYAQGIQTSKTFVVSAGTGGLGKLRRPAHESTVNLAPPESRRNVNSWVPGSMVSSFCAFSICSWATSHTPRKEKKQVQPVFSSSQNTNIWVLLARGAPPPRAAWQTRRSTPAPVRQGRRGIILLQSKTERATERTLKQLAPSSPVLGRESCTPPLAASKSAWTLPS